MAVFSVMSVVVIAAILAKREKLQEMIALLREVTLSDDAAEMRELVRLCQRSPRVFRWITGRIEAGSSALDAARTFLGNTGRDEAKSVALSFSLYEEITGRPRPPRTKTGGPHGGLTELEVNALTMRYHAANMDEIAFVLTRLWLRIQADGKRAPSALQQRTLAYWRTVVADGTGRKAHDLRKVIP